MKNVSHYKLNWRPDRPDRRDLYVLAATGADPIPAAFSLANFLPPVYDQGHVGSCTANAACAAFLFDRIKASVPGDSIDEISRLFLYYNTRSLEGCADYDGGASIRDTVKSLAKFGVALEELWPYDFREVTVRPQKTAYLDASSRRAFSYGKVAETLDGIKRALFEGYPVVFGFTVYENFYSIKEDGLMPVPAPSDSALGGHAVLAFGWDDVSGSLLVRNSWGDDWGDRGNFFMPYDCLNLTSDYWQVRSIVWQTK